MGVFLLPRAAAESCEEPAHVDQAMTRYRLTAYVNAREQGVKNERIKNE